MAVNILLSVLVCLMLMIFGIVMGCSGDKETEKPTINALLTKSASNLNTVKICAIILVIIELLRELFSLINYFTL